MKISFVASTAFSMIASCLAASAADLPARIPAKAPPVVATVANWTGLYIGGHGGGGWGNADYLSDATIGFQQFFIAETEPKGWLAGGQIGARYQWSPSWVVGLEFSGSASGLRDTIPGAQVGREHKTKIESLLSATVQLGYAWDRWLVYVKGGWAGGQIELEGNNLVNGFFNTWRGFATGGTIGAGLEWQLVHNFSLAAEYAFYHLRMDDTTSINNGGNPRSANDFKANIHAATARLNYRFSSSL